MRRIDGANAVQEIVRNLELEKADAPGNVTGKRCPKCLENGIESSMVVRQGRYGTFGGCTRYPACRHTEKILKRSAGK